MIKKILKNTISIILATVMCFVSFTSAFAASSANKKSYVKEMIISYGNSDEEAKSWLKDNEYKIIDNNINEGADDTFSTKRAVYLGYKTTTNAEEAITDMKLMNMKGGYSVEDYQKLLNDQKSSIKFFIDNFICAINEYRTNYKKGQERAKAAHDMLNLLYDDDTQQKLGDLFLNKIKEEYAEEEFNALTEDEQSKIADMTTILMQANGTAVLAIEQLIAIATDSGDSVWSDRYSEALSYDEMVERLIDEDNITKNEASKKLAAEYDEDAKAIASKLEDYKSYLEVYTEESVSFSSTNEELEIFNEDKENEDVAEWIAAGTQYVALQKLENDDISLLDIIFSDEYDLENEDSYLLYPLVSVLTDGQRACLDFLPMYQIVSMGLNNDSSVKKAIENVDIDSANGEYESIYDGIDRSIFSNQVAMTGEAYNLQNSSDMDASDNWFTGGISTATKIMYIAFGVSVIATVATFITASHYTELYKQLVASPLENVMVCVNEGEPLDDYFVGRVFEYQPASEADKLEYAAQVGKARNWSNVFNYAGVAMAAISIILLSISAWNTYTELQAYYNTELTPIPMHMVNQGVNDKDEKVFTYYTAVKCNRESAGMITDRTSLLEDFGDINGDVGREWVALYTTKDKSAGNPITADFIVQYGNTDIPGDDTPLSMFAESVAQNLTNEKSGYTYSNDKNGIYLFYGTDDIVYAGSVFSNSTYVIIGAFAVVILILITFFIIRNAKKRRTNTED